MNKERREYIQAIKDFNYSGKEHYAQMFFRKSYYKLTWQERLDVNDTVKGNNE